MNDETNFEVVASFDDHYSWKTSSKHVVPIESDKELNHECEVEDSSRNIETNLVDEWFRTQMALEYVLNQERQRLITTKKEFVQKLANKA